MLASLSERVRKKEEEGGVMRKRRKIVQEEDVWDAEEVLLL